MIRYRHMARFVPDINTKRWVVIAPTRAKRSDEAKQKRGDPYAVIQKDGYNYHDDCPFCLGNEHLTPPEVYRWGVHYPDNKQWLVRVVPNKYPITDIHEVIIHSPDHLKDIADFGEDQVEILLKVYRERYNALSPRGTVMIFNNTGPRSGESLVHPHSQVVVIPHQITLDALILEPVGNIVDENDSFITFCPDFSQWPYEVWLAPKRCCQQGHQGQCQFGTISDGEITALSSTFQGTLQKLLKKFPKLSYNFYIYPHACWYLRIIPRLIDRAGFELGTGFSVNITDPQEAAKELTSNQEY